MQLLRSGFALFIVSLFLLSGCATAPVQEQPLDVTPFVGGTTALAMSFLEGAPPEEIFDNGNYPFSIVVKLENLGEDDVNPEDGYIEILGINPVDFGLGGQEDLIQALPAHIGGVVKNYEGTVLVGDTIVLEFNGLNYLPDIHGTFAPLIRANLCYNYFTRATSSICVKRDLLSNIDTKEICEISGDKYVANSGAPIQVTQFHQNPLGSNKVQITFTVEHLGTPNDRFYKLDTDCDDIATNPYKDMVYVEVVSDVNGKIPQCSGLIDPLPNGNGGFVKLYNGNPRKVVCVIDTSNIQSVFEDVVEINLGYRYGQFIETVLPIRDVSAAEPGVIN